MPGDDASTAEVAPGRVERDDQGEERRANTTPNGEPHLEIGRLRLKTCSKFDFLIAETWPTYIPYTGIFYDIGLLTYYETQVLGAEAKNSLPRTGGVPGTVEL